MKHDPPDLERFLVILSLALLSIAIIGMLFS